MRQRLSNRTLKAAGRNTQQGERGAYLVEFAVASLVFFLMLFGVMEFGRAIWAYNSMAHAAREGARYAIVRGSESGRAASTTDVEAYVRDRAGLNTAQVTTTWVPDNKPGSEVQVSVRYNFQPALPFIPSMVLSSTSRMMISF
ncbi:MAG: TadE/TadG family type IV pilus assembly protein [Pyrinomonadaceae bacterium]